ncbi:uncharacterized protein LOC128549355 [Mercenaria mercenaria]|uniref:uncharacterized protein LOC128549355 n=1 Tax=Mercenaria mercenaria TaxID=6596 RepID=UPI00234EFCAB|nr:uncharacterized protein LOC128549355 [Mercenaria mercenaria]
MNDQLVNVIKQCDVMLTPQVFISIDSNEDASENVPNISIGDEPMLEVSEPEESSNKKAKGKGKGKRKGKSSTISQSKGKKSKRRKDDVEAESEESNCCLICFETFDDSPNWICCDRCNKWVHGHCVGIQTEEQWENYTDETVQFYCPFCE